MTKIYANLLGTWVCLSDDENCVIGDYGKNPNSWWKEGAEVWYPANRNTDSENSIYYMPYVNIYYKGIKYRINPIFIQIVTE
ncbi:MAG: hypothetical protein RR766_00090 [Longicatena sp.]|uniref:hypothetical protein n=1 Tax=Anaerorhabdus sp. TaxID=1872524 RepID=UPI002FC9F361